MFFLPLLSQCWYIQARPVTSKREGGSIKKERLKGGKLNTIVINVNRQSLLTKAAQDITPKNGGAFPWAGADASKFEQEWSMKPVTLKGYLDHDKELKVLKYHHGEKGVEVVTPFYTHLDKQDRPCAVLVNRGWMPWDLKDFRYDRANNVTQISGVLYRGDAKTKYSKPNQPALNTYKSVYPEELAVISQLPNEEAQTFMLKAIDFDTEARTAMPDVPSAEELTKFHISPERHEAYEKLWNAFTYFGVVANTAFWLYL